MIYIDDVDYVDDDDDVDHLDGQEKNLTNMILIGIMKIFSVNFEDL